MDTNVALTRLEYQTYMAAQSYMRLVHEGRMDDARKVMNALKKCLNEG